MSISELCQRWTSILHSHCTRKLAWGFIQFHWNWRKVVFCILTILVKNITWTLPRWLNTVTRYGPYTAVNKPFTTVYDCVCTVYVFFFVVNQADDLRPYFNGNTAVFWLYINHIRQYFHWNTVVNHRSGLRAVFNALRPYLHRILSPGYVHTKCDFEMRTLFKRSIWKRWFFVVFSRYLFFRRKHISLSNEPNIILTVLETLKTCDFFNGAANAAAHQTTQTEDDGNQSSAYPVLTNRNRHLHHVILQESFLSAIGYRSILLMSLCPFVLLQKKNTLIYWSKSFQPIRSVFSK